MHETQIVPVIFIRSLFTMRFIISNKNNLLSHNEVFPAIGEDWSVNPV